MRAIFALIDCNNFFASCERVFAPEYKNKPVAVLSNNDGCIIARSEEVKRLGVPMGAPVFKWERVLRQNRVKLFSANFSLYGDMSLRVMDTLRQFSPNIEIYSIDEAFLILPQMSSISLTNYCHKIRKTIYKWTGIPVSIGVGGTKTLAKAANELAKQDSHLEGVLDFSPMDEHQIDNYLTKLPVGDIWGIGYRSAPKLITQGIHNANQFKYAPDKWIKQIFKMPGLRTQMELRGTPCLQLEESHDRQKSIISSRSFSRPVTTLKELEEAVATYASRAAEKLREDNSAASIVYTYIMTNYHKKGEPQYYNSHGVKLSSATAYTPQIIKAAHEALRLVFKPGFKYKKALVGLGGIVARNSIQNDLFSEHIYTKREEDLMKSIDHLNRKWGNTIVQVSSIGLGNTWHAKSSQKSQAYTTDWGQLLEIRT